MTIEEIQKTAVDLYNALVEIKSSGFTMKVEGGWIMEVVISKDISPLFEAISKAEITTIYDE